MKLRIIGTAVALAALALPAGASAAKKDKGEPVTVMTRNLYLGADLGPAIGAPDLCSAIDGAGVIHNDVQRTNFPERVKPLAREIKKAKADLVGLQEVATWRKQVPSDNGGPPISPDPNATLATEVDYDFLRLLTAELKRQKAKYKVVGVQQEFDAELPANIDGDPSTGGTCGADLDYRLTMHDVILALKGVKTKKLKMANYTTRYEAEISGIKVPADRGWLSTEAKVGKAKLRFVNTHLEAFGDPRIREAQAKELEQTALKTKKQIVLVGDINSGTTKKHNVGRPELGHDPNDPLAFKSLKKFGMKDRGAQHTSSHGSALNDPNSTFTHTIDHVLVKPKVKKLDAYVTGDDRKQMTPSGLWPSDHGGVVSTLLIPKR